MEKVATWMVIFRLIALFPSHGVLSVYEQRKFFYLITNLLILQVDNS